MEVEGVGPFGDARRLALLDRLPEVVVVLDDGARVWWMNGSGRRILGWELDDVVGTNVFDLIHPDDLGYMLSSWEKRVEHPDEPGLIVQGRARRADGSWWACEVVGLSLLEDSTVGGMVITARDVSRQAALADSPGRLRSMVDRTTDILLLLSEGGRFVYANRRITALLGHDSDRIVGASWTDIVDLADVGAALAWFRRLVAAGDGATSRLQVRLVGPGERSLTAELHGTNQLADPLIGGLIVAARDVDEVLAMQRMLEERNERLSHAVTHDMLTGLYSRRAFVEAVEQAIVDRRRAALTLAGADDVVVLFCDHDGFKAVNDRFGHAIGDRFLSEVARRLEQACREDDLVARYGGDEFTILLGNGESAAGVNALIARLTGALGAPMNVDGVTARVGVSVGVSRAPAAEADVDALLGAADAAMYERKRARQGAD
jgi:diguanylate cyclase (GGDEF)-like protein/PAS domain S-box-containing protein